MLGGCRKRERGSVEWMNDKAGWRMWHLSLHVEDEKVLTFGLLIFLSLPGSVRLHTVWLLN